MSIEKIIIAVYLSIDGLYSIVVMKPLRYPNFYKYCANLWQINQKITAYFTACCDQDNIHSINEVFIPARVVE